MFKKPQNQSKEWKIPVGNGFPDMCITLKMLCDDKTDYVFSFIVSDIGHPYIDPNKTGKVYSYVGDESKNPALLPATKHAVDLFYKNINEIEKKEPFKAAAISYGIPRKTVDSLVSKSAIAQYTPSTSRLFPEKGTVSARQMKKAFDTLVAIFEKEMPKIKKIVADNQHLQPKEDPSPLEISKVAVGVENKWVAAMEDLKSKGMEPEHGSPSRGSMN